jgi:phosphoribosylanthranilate isomerase
MRVFVKICGLNTAAAVEAAVNAGADALGFVFADSPRQIAPAAALALTRDLPPGLVTVAVMRHPSKDELAEVLDVFRPDWLQTDAEDFDAVALPSGTQRVPVHRDTAALNMAAAGREPLVLFEGAESGHGQLADWGRARTLAGMTRLILAGGLNPDNVANAIRAVRPYGVDVSSGVERERGVKDTARVAAFVRAVRKMEDVNAD